MFQATTEQRVSLADQLHAYADAIAAGQVALPVLRYQDLDGERDRLRVVPRLLHDVLCAVRIATPQTGSNPIVSHCAFCGLCYPRAEPETESTAGATTATGIRTVTIRWITDDYVEILIDGTVEIEANADEHGRDGIATAITTARRFAARAGADVLVEGSPNSDA